MAGVNMDLDTGQIDRDDTKRIRVVGRDAQGNKLKLDEIDLSLVVGGSETTFSIGDFSAQNDEYTTKHQFQNSGLLDVDCTIKDDPNLDTERETDQSNLVRD
jgi:hypothetical protein